MKLNFLKDTIKKYQIIKCFVLNDSVVHKEKWLYSGLFCILSYHINDNREDNDFLWLS